MRSLIIIRIYITIIILCALLYYFSNGMINNVDTVIDSIYFSVVTITTLGYGDMLPCTNWGKMAVSLEAIIGVILLGFFLIRVSLDVVEKSERKRIEIIKLNFKSQYEIWRENTINILVSLTSDKNVNTKNLYEVSKFRDYMKKDVNKHWYEVLNSLSDTTYSSIFYKKELLHEIEFLQRNIETLLMQVPIEDIDSLQVLNRYINGLYKLRKQDLSENDEFRSFVRRLWALITSYDANTGEYDKNYLINVIESI